MSGTMKIKERDEMKLKKIIDQAKADNPKSAENPKGIEPNAKAVMVGCNILPQLFPSVKIKKGFFQSLNPEQDNTWRLYLVTEQDEAIVLPIYPTCPIHLVTKDGMVDEIKEFIKLTAGQKKDLSERLGRQESEYSEYLKEIEPKEKAKKKTEKLKRVK